MRTNTLRAFAVCGLLALAGAAGCGGDDAAVEAEPVVAATPTAQAAADTTVRFPAGNLTKAGDYRIRVASQAEAERLCGAARDGGWPKGWAAYHEVRLSFPGPDLYCVPD
jgi:hypothetical protein